MSPTSLKVALRSINRGREMPFNEIFTMENRLTERFLADKDFYEGCRAILIDKDRNPKWSPPTLAEVEESTIDRYFSPLPESDELKLKIFAKLF